MTIALNGIGASFPNPGIYVQINFAAGPSTGPNTQKVVILLGNGKSGGSAVTGTVYGPSTPVTLSSESDAITLFGAGSQLHTMYWRFTSINSTTVVYAIQIAASGGSAATGVVTVATTATASMTLRLWVEDQSVDVPINTGDTATVIGDNIVKYVAGQFRWPVTPVNASGTVTLTCNVIGPEGNALYFQAAIIGGNGSTTVTPTANTAMTGGTTVDDNTTILADIVSQKFDYYILGDSDFGTGTPANVSRAATQISSMAQPTIGIRQQLIVGSQDSIANANTKAIALNNARTQLIWGHCTDLLPSSIAATMGAIYVLFEVSGPLPINRCNFSQFPVNANDRLFWNVIPSRSGASVAPTTTQITTMLNSGVSPLQVIGGTNVVLSKRITTYSLTNAVLDFRVRDGHIPSVCDAYALAIATSTALQFSGYNLANDPATGQPVPPNCITPGMWLADVNTNTLRFAGYGLTVNPNQTIAATTVVASGDRLSVNPPIQVCNIADQFALLISQVA